MITDEKSLLETIAGVERKYLVASFASDGKSSIVNVLQSTVWTCCGLRRFVFLVMEERRVSICRNLTGFILIKVSTCMKD